MMTGFAYPEISPIIVQIGPLALRWYSMAYLFGILFGWWLAAKRIKKYQIPLTKNNLEDIVFYFTLGVILGGRLGYVLAYGTEKFWLNPLEIFAVWHGGMSFHGGIVGVIIAMYLAAKHVNFSFFKTDGFYGSVGSGWNIFGSLGKFC